MELCFTIVEFLDSKCSFAQLDSMKQCSILVCTSSSKQNSNETLIKVSKQYKRVIRLDTSRLQVLNALVRAIDAFANAYLMPCFLVNSEFYFSISTGSKRSDDFKS